MKREPFQVGQGHGQRRPTDQGLLENPGECLSRATTEIHGTQVRQSHEELPDHLHADVAFQMFLQQTFLQIGEQFQALQEGLGGQVLDFGVHLLSATQADGGEVREVQTAHQCSQRRILRHMIQCLGENDGVWESHVPVQDTQSSSVQSVGCKQTRDQIHVARSVAIWWKIDRQVRDDLIYQRLLAHEKQEWQG